MLGRRSCGLSVPLVRSVLHEEWIGAVTIGFADRRERGDSCIVDVVVVGHDRNLESALIFRFWERKKDGESRVSTDGATDLTG